MRGVYRSRENHRTIICAGPSFLRDLKIFDPSHFADPREGPRPRRTTMATLQSIPRFLLPRGTQLLGRQPRALRPLSSPTSLRHASISAKGLSEEFRRRREAQQSKGTPVIPQPDKYRPPSHSKKAPNRNLENKVYGPPISEEDRKRMATKKYPNMMSPEGTFSHWFLHNKAIHLWITMVHITLLPTIHFPGPSKLTPLTTGYSRLTRSNSMVPGLCHQDYLRAPPSLA